MRGLQRKILYQTESIAEEIVVGLTITPLHGYLYATVCDSMKNTFGFYLFPRAVFNPPQLL